MTPLYLLTPKGNRVTVQTETPPSQAELEALSDLVDAMVGDPPFSAAIKPTPDV